MSIQSLSSRIKALQADLESLHDQLARESQWLASNSARIASLMGSITRRTTPSTVQSKMREGARLEGENSRIQDKIASINKRVSEKTSDLFNQQRHLAAEQAKLQGKTERELARLRDQETKRDREYLSQIRSILSTPMPDATTPNAMVSSYHAFISHASEDKDQVVRPLARLLAKLGYSIWYDEFELKVGDSLRRKIDLGLARSRFGIVVLSPDFFAKNWPQYELDGLVAREVEGQKVVLPIWHRVSKDDVLQYSPPLADKLALSTTSYTISELASRIAQVLAGE